MDYLISGATGFIGRKLVAQLLAGGHEVNYVGRKRSRALDLRASFHYWNPEQAPPLDSINRLDAIVHLAGEPVAQRWTKEVKQRIYTSRVEGTRKLVRAIEKLKHKPSVLVSASATGYYGNRGDELLTESSTPGADFLSSLCLDWEREALAAAAFGLRVVVVRIAVVLGKGGGALQRMTKPFRLGIGGRLGSGRQWMPWIHVDDLVRLLIFAAENPNVSGALNGCAPQPVRNSEFTQTLARVLHRPAILPVPKFALKLALGEVADFLLTSERVVPEATAATGYEWKYPTLDEALRNVLS